MKNFARCQTNQTDYKRRQTLWHYFNEKAVGYLTVVLLRLLFVQHLVDCDCFRTVISKLVVTHVLNDNKLRAKD
jgi:hypothetical protein